MKNSNQKLNAIVSVKSHSKNGHTFNNFVLSIPTDNGSIDVQFKLAFNNPKLAYKIRKFLEESEAK